MTARRELQLAVVLCLLGSGLVLFALSQTWVSFEDSQELTIDAVRTSVRGSTVSSGAQALGLVGLVGVVALAATRRSGRILVGALLLLAGLGVVVTVVDVLGATTRSLAVRGLDGCDVGQACAALLTELARSHAWPWVALVGGALLASSGLLVAARGAGWGALSSSYEPPVARATAPASATDTGPATTDTGAATTGTGPATDKSVWDALDRGEDPTS